MSLEPYSRRFLCLGYFFFGMAVTILVTDVGKYTIGRLRPHFLDVCKPNLTELCTDPYAYVPPERMHCTGKPSAIRAARLSFPSGHSSTSAYTMVFLVVSATIALAYLVGSNFGLVAALPSISHDLVSWRLAFQAHTSTRRVVVGGCDRPESGFGFQASLERRPSGFRFGYCSGFCYGKLCWVCLNGPRS